MIPIKNIFIANRSLRKTKRHFNKEKKTIGISFWYGYPTMEPYVLGFWIFFKTDEILNAAEKSNLTIQVKEHLFNKMKDMGYTKTAFENNYRSIDRSKIHFILEISDEEKEKHFNMIEHKTMGVNFGSEETVKRDYQGNYYNYTK